VLIPLIGFTSSTIHVDTSTGLSAGQIIAVQSVLNTGLYQVQSHNLNVITININSIPDEPFLKSSMNIETANGNVMPV
jgi:hypothetical protein